jgi:hypothetical protein
MRVERKSDAIALAAEFMDERLPSESGTETMQPFG